MEKYREYQVDATWGPRVAVGENIIPGQSLGNSPMGGEAICRYYGVVISITFDGENHVHRVLLRLHRGDEEPLERRADYF